MIDSNINPNIWGKHAWNFIHIVSSSYPSNPTIYQKKAYKKFFISLKDVLPCSNCRKHFTKNIKLYNIDNYLNNRNSLFKWTVIMHNLVNKISKKKEVSYNTAKTYYNNLIGFKAISDKKVIVSKNVKSVNNVNNVKNDNSPTQSSFKKNLLLIFVICICIILLIKYILPKK